MTKDKTINIVLTGYDENGKYIGMQEQAVRLVKIVRTVPEDKNETNITSHNKEGIL